MNIKEFAALKVGDKIQNAASGNPSIGEVVETTDNGVRVVWGERSDRETRFFYNVVGTSWMNWSKVLDKLADGCCSSVVPCAWQKQHPESICEICIQARMQAAAP